MVQLMPLHPKVPSSLALFESRPVLHFWYWLTQVVLEKWPLNGCSSGGGGGGGSSSSSSSEGQITTTVICVNHKTMLRISHQSNTYTYYYHYHYNALLDALHWQSGTHCRKLFSVVTLLQFLSLG